MATRAQRTKARRPRCTASQDDALELRCSTTVSSPKYNLVCIVPPHSTFTAAVPDTALPRTNSSVAPRQAVPPQLFRRQQSVYAPSGLEACHRRRSFAIRCASARSVDTDRNRARQHTRRRGGYTTMRRDPWVGGRHGLRGSGGGRRAAYRSSRAAHCGTSASRSREPACRPQSWRPGPRPPQPCSRRTPTLPGPPRNETAPGMCGGSTRVVKDGAELSRGPREPACREPADTSEPSCASPAA